MSDETHDLHPSTLERWSRCSHAALEHWRNPDRWGPADEHRHVASWVGTSVHRMTAGLEPLDPPPTMRFDQVTPSRDYAEKQIRSMAVLARNSLRKQSWTVEAQEESLEFRPDFAPWLRLVGQCDWRVSLGLDGGIGDLKTGASVGGAWLQIGTYCVMADAADYAIVMHLPRRPLLKLDPPTLEFRPGYLVARASMTLVKRVARIISGSEPATHAPGAWCSLCPLECPVRAQPYGG